MSELQCRRKFNERTGTPFNKLEYPTDVVLLVVRWYLRYSLSLRDLEEIFAERGFKFTFETVRDWVERFAPLIIEELRGKRAGKAGFSWYTDETYVRIKGEWCYLYRTIDREGQLVETMLSKTRDLVAARRFLTSARNVTKRRHERVTTDGHPVCPKAIADACGSTWCIGHHPSCTCSRIVKRLGRGDRLLGGFLRTAPSQNL